MLNSGEREDYDGFGVRSIGLESMEMPSAPLSPAGCFLYVFPLYEKLSAPLFRAWLRAFIYGFILEDLFLEEALKLTLERVSGQAAAVLITQQAYGHYLMLLWRIV